LAVSLLELVGKVPTSTIESTFKRLALESGVEINAGVPVTSLDQLESEFPTAKYIIGADGRRSVVREERFDNALCQDYSVMKIAFCKYEVSGDTEALGWLEYIKLSQANDNVKHSIKEIVGRKKDGVTAVTLQIFVGNEEFEALGSFTAKSPASIDDLHRVSPVLGASMQAWIKQRVESHAEEIIDRPRINRVPLDVYQAASVVRRGGGCTTPHDDGRMFALVGDAAFGVPFFRALNDGLLCATALSNAIAEDYAEDEDGSMRDLIDDYGRFFKKMARRERAMIHGKGLAIRAGVASKNAKRTLIHSKGQFWKGVVASVTPTFPGPRSNPGRSETYESYESYAAREEATSSRRDKKEPQRRCMDCGRGSETEGCVHQGKWHSSFGDCGPTCAWGLGPGRIGEMHFDCCYTSKKFCPKGKHRLLEVMAPEDRSNHRLHEVMALEENSESSLIERITTAMREQEASVAQEHSEEEQENEEPWRGEMFTADSRIPTHDFYERYFGHDPVFLGMLHERFRSNGKSIIWLAGDSTLDNKYWLGWERVTAVNGYEDVFDDPLAARADVSHWVNQELVDRGASDWASICCAREEHTLSKGMNEQDRFVQQHIQANDILVCCIGGNDIALAPSPTTIAKMLWLTQFAKKENIINGSAGGLSHFFDIFGAQTQAYIEQLVARTRPRAVVVCMLYYLDENPDPDAWANGVLNLLGYNSDPSILQSLIQGCFLNGTLNIRIEGTLVIPVPLFKHMNGKDTRDYAERVEPSSRGGHKMAAAVTEALMRVL